MTPRSIVEIATRHIFGMVVRQRFGTTIRFKAALAAAPIEGIELSERDLGSNVSV